jgi:Spy/CpxP family protein refolding chaperone
MAACTTLTVAQGVFAADDVTPPKGRGPEAMNRGKWGADELAQRLGRMTRDLGLTEEQQAKIKPILTDEYAQLEKLRGNDTFNRDERRAALQKLNESTFEKIQPILTPEQQKKQEELKKYIKERRHQQRGSKPGPDQTRGAALSDPERRLEHLTLELTLTAEQQARIKPILEGEFAQLEKVRGNDALNRDERRARLQELNLATYEEIKPVLTPEQLKKYDGIKQKIKDRRSMKKSPKKVAPAPKP